MTVGTFEEAVAAVQEIGTDPGSETKLRLYALYKQATEGDVSGSRPGILNPVGRAKYDAWAELQGVTEDAAAASYVDEVNALIG